MVERAEEKLTQRMSFPLSRMGRMASWNSPTLTAEVEQSEPSRIFWKNSLLLISGWKTSFLWLTPSRV